MSAATSATCGGRAPRKAPQSPSRSWKIREGTCFSTCAPPSSRCSSRNPCWRSHARVWSSTTACSAVSRDRYKAGDIAQVDLDRLELQRVQFETDVQTALVNLRTAKIQLADAAQRSHAGRETGRQRAVRLRGDPHPFGGVPPERIRFPGRLACGDASRRQGQRRITGSPSPTVRPIRRSHGTSDARKPYSCVCRRRRHDSPAHLRPEPGREGAHAARYQAQ